MSLTSKVLLILALAIGAFALLEALIQQRTILPSFQELERREAVTSLRRCMEILRSELESLERVTADWAAWDDTYAYVAEPDEEYVESNFVPATYIDNELNVILLLDPNGRRLAGEVYDLQQGEPVEIPQIPQDLPADHPLMDLGEDGLGRTGLWNTDLGPMLFASQPVLRSDNSGPSRGVFVMGWALTPERFRSVRRRAMVDVQYWPASAVEHLPMAERGALARLADQPAPQIVEASDDLLYAYTAFPEVTGGAGILIRVDVPRLITDKGRSSLWHARASLLAAGVTVLVAVVALLEGSVLRPIRRLTRHMEAVGRSDQPPDRLDTDRGDEIGLLARQYEGMLASLDRARQELLDYQHRLREMSMELSRAEEIQRRHISAELHDRIGQTLFAVKAQVETLRDRTTDPDAAERLGKLFALLDEVMRDVWSLTFDLSPPMLYEVGLEAAVESLLERMQKRTGIDCRMEEVEGGLRPSPPDEVRAMLFQVVRELLANVEKHAEASRVTVRFGGGGQALLQLAVEDDGKGFDPSQRPRRRDTGGFGLFSVRERLRCLGGNVDVRSAPGEGTCVVLTLPTAMSVATRKVCNEHPDSVGG